MEEIVFDLDWDMFMSYRWLFGYGYAVVICGILIFKYNLGEHCARYFFGRRWTVEVREAICAVTAILALYYAF